MKRTEAIQVGDLLRRMFESDSEADRQFLRQKASYLWSEVAGPTVNRLTLRRYVDSDDVLHVFIASGPVKAELAFMVAGFADKINGLIGRKIIKKVIIH